MDSTTGGVLGIFGILISSGGVLYAAINHKRIRCRCCGKNLDVSVDVDPTIIKKKKKTSATNVIEEEQKTPEDTLEQEEEVTEEHVEEHDEEHDEEAAEEIPPPKRHKKSKVVPY
jgi:hypothetical protein